MEKPRCCRARQLCVQGGMLLPLAVEVLQPLDGRGPRAELPLAPAAYLQLRRLPRGRVQRAEGDDALGGLQAAVRPHVPRHAHCSSSSMTAAVSAKARGICQHNTPATAANKRRCTASCAQAPRSECRRRRPVAAVPSPPSISSSSANSACVQGDKLGSVGCAQQRGREAAGFALGTHHRCFALKPMDSRPRVRSVCLGSRACSDRRASRLRAFGTRGGGSGGAAGALG